MRAQRVAQPDVRHPWRAAKVALAVVAAAAVVWALAWSPFVAVRDVIVVTPDKATASFIRSYVNLPLHISILTYPRSWVAEAASRCPVVRTAVAKRRVLRQTFEVIPELRTTMCAVATDSGYLTIDEEGVAFGALSELPAGLPVAEGFHPSPSRIGERVHPWYAQLVGSCIRGARESGLKGSLVVDVANRHLVTLTTADGVLCRLGGPEDLPLKVSLCADILRSIAASGYKAEYVDVQVPDRPVWKPKGAAPVGEQPVEAKATKAPAHPPAAKPKPAKKPADTKARKAKGKSDADGEKDD